MQIAVEEALRVKEAKLAEEVVAVSIGPKQARAGGGHARATAEQAAAPHPDVGWLGAC